MLRRMTVMVIVGIVFALVAPVWAQSDPAAEVDGVWRSLGYGYVMDVQGDRMTIYEETAISCLEWLDEPAEALGLTLRLDGDQLIVTDDLTIMVAAERLPELPALCANGGTPATDDPETNFEVFWHHFAEQYAFFDLHGIDWQAMYDHYRPQVTAETTPEELFALMAEMLTPLEDGHVVLDSGFDIFSPGVMPAWGATDEQLFAVIRQELDTLVTDYLHADDAFLAEHFIITPAGVGAKSSLFYGELSDEIGYINLITMLPTEEDWESVDRAIDEAVAALVDKRALVIDVRLNGGGLDAAALTFASRFADEARLAYSKHARDGEDFTPAREFTVAPDGPQQFTGPVVVLTSSLTASAAEIFVMAMRVLPNVTVMGEPTSGAHSDMLERTLPNGWVMSLSNEEYVLASGDVFEGVGIPPQIAVAFDPAALANGQDVMLDAALEFLAR
ncbi:MAG: S41 family peptidase [Anaerolineae bacterium]|nr:S41 family peptidase [Anaerolineae bacterium]